ncbi:hypothetical protein HanIR_Chr12g0614461 [Helianthus annuus]|nr:hypothetical protein HanIR_Chr12g0614461 [Helianthus annuus]
MHMIPLSNNTMGSRNMSGGLSNVRLIGLITRSAFLKLDLPRRKYPLQPILAHMPVRKIIPFLQIPDRSMRISSILLRIAPIIIISQSFLWTDRRLLTGTG